ncbi:MAG: type I pullulanase [Coprobacillus sp.]|nr:type I pullulanase [Coprobacillus sp.]
MINTYVTAKLVSLRRINVCIYSSARDDTHRFYLKKDNNFPREVNILRKVSSNGLSLFALELDQDFEFGHNYELNLSSFSPITIDVSDAPTFPEFDEMFTYNGDDLGAIYSPTKTSFAVWAPMALSVSLKIESDEDNFEIIPMERRDKGVYKLTLKGDYLGKKYHYIVNNYSVTKECNDPYGKGTSLNSTYSVVVDYKSIAAKERVVCPTPLKGYTDHIIYETHIRDFTESKDTDIEHKGTYTGFFEEGRKTTNGKPAGLDYIKYLGVTTVQVQPILDYDNVSDLHHENNYNWGYDPISMFALEGSLSVDPTDPHKRLEEFRDLVDTYHKNDLRIVVDVVYNHVWDHLYNDFEKIVPNYFFRRRNNQYITEHSGCGNDFASERPMARKAIVDSMKYLTETFDVDGFRLDIMGLIDEKTMNEAYEECAKMKPDIIIYGEGWDMNTECKDQMASMYHASELLHLGFFNDTYRDIVKGPIFDNDLTKGGYISGDQSYREGMVYALFGTCILEGGEKFASSTQSINYIECHDNHTLYDKLSFVNEGEDEDTLLKRVSLGNTIVSLSFGVPFFHMGQEIGLSKHGLGNTYNTPKINNMNYQVVEERWKMVESFREANLIRRRTPLYSEKSKEKIRDGLEYDLDHYPLVILSTKNKDVLGNNKDAIFVLNSTNEVQNLDLDDYYSIYYFDGRVINSQESIKHMMVNPLSATIIVK